MAPARQSLPVARVSASATIFSLAALDSTTRCAFSALRASRWDAITGPSESSRPMRDARSPTALASATWADTVFTDSAASSGDMTPERTRWPSRSTSAARAS